MLYIYHLCKLVHVQIWGNYVSVYASYELTTKWPGAVVYIYFTLLVHAHEQICLSNCAYMSHCTNTAVYIHTHLTLLHISVKRKQTGTSIYHAITILCASDKYAHQISYICHMPKFLNVYHWKKYTNTCATYELTNINHVTRSEIHTTNLLDPFISIILLVTI